MNAMFWRAEQHTQVYFGVHLPVLLDEQLQAMRLLFQMSRTLALDGVAGRAHRPKAALSPFCEAPRSVAALPSGYAARGAEMATRNCGDEFKREAVRSSGCGGIRSGRPRGVWGVARTFCANACRFLRNLPPRRRALIARPRTNG